MQKVSSSLLLLLKKQLLDSCPLKIVCHHHTMPELATNVILRNSVPHIPALINSKVYMFIEIMVNMASKYLIC